MEVEKDLAKAEENKKRQNQMDEYLSNNPAVTPGQVVRGTIEDIRDDKVYVYIPGVKKEVEMLLSDCEEEPVRGNEIEGLLRQDAKGKYQLTKKKTLNEDDIKFFEDAQENKTPVIGEFCSIVSSKTEKDGKEEVHLSGYEVKLSDEYYGFCPLSKADVEHVAKPETLLGVKDYFYIDNFYRNPRKKSIVNRRAYLQEQIDAAKKEFFDSVGVGDVVEGTVKTITNFGAFVDFGGFDGLLHINDISWGRVTKAKNFVKKGETLRLRVLSVDKEKFKINLSLKDMQENPWKTFDTRYSVGQVIKGPVVRVTNFGIFIEIEPGIEGLAHVSELSWSKKIFNPADVYHVKDVVEAKILGYDLDQERISLGVRELIENPWNTIAEKYPVGTKLSAEAVKVTQYGAFFRIDSDIDGFLSNEDISWTDKVSDMRTWVKEGETRDVMVSHIDTKTQRIRLSVKSFSDNPWQLFADNYPKNSTVKCTVVSVGDKGINVKVNDDIQGFINRHNVNVEDGERMEDKYKVGDEINAIVVEVNPHSAKLFLSAKEYEKREQLGDYQKYMSSSKSAEEGTGYTLGDILSKDEKNE